MPSSFEKLHLLRTAYKRLHDAAFEGGSVVGKLEATEENCRLAAELDAANLIFPTEDFSQPKQGIFYRIELVVPRDRRAFFASSLDDLLDSQLCARYEAPSAFYFADADEICTATEPANSEIAQYYLQALKAVSLLKLVADYSDASTGVLKLVFLQREKLEIPVIFHASSTKSLQKLDEWLSLLSADIHREQRKTIFRTVLLEELRHAESKERFIRFLALFEHLFGRFQDNYQLYVAEFSFEKVLSEITEKKLDYILKLNKTFSDIQNQLLAIPVAVILAGSQMEAVGKITTKNSMVVAGVVVFALLMALLIRNQLDNVAAIGRDIHQQHAYLQHKQMPLADRFNGAYVELEKREKRQRVLIRIVDGMVALSLFGTTTLFAWYSGILPSMTVFGM